MITLYIKFCKILYPTCTGVRYVEPSTVPFVVIRDFHYLTRLPLFNPPSIKTMLALFLYFLGKFDLQEGAAEHMSATSIVVRAYAGGS